MLARNSNCNVLFGNASSKLFDLMLPSSPKRKKMLFKPERNNTWCTLFLSRMTAP